MNKTKKLALIALALAIANLIVFDGIVENTCKKHRPLHCEYNIITEARICK